MKIEYSNILNQGGKYVFDEIEKKVAQLRAEGTEIIDLGVGDPAKVDPPPDFVISSLSKFAEQRKHGGYPRCKGDQAFLQSCAKYMKREFNVDLDPETEINVTIGSKEAVYHFPKVVVNPGDIVICPTPGYPPFHLGTIAAYGTPYYVPLYEENNFLPDFSAIPPKIAEKAKIIWINYPNSPTGAVAPLEWYEKLIAWAHKYNIIIAADEGAYIEISFEEKQHSILEITKEGVIAFYSLSKRNNMTGYRIGFAAGDERIIKGFNQLRNQQDNGVPQFIQEAAVLALEDTNFIETMRKSYKEKREIIINAFQQRGFPRSKSEATFFMWQKAPEGMSGSELAQRLLDIGIVVIPGDSLTQPTTFGKNPGEDYVRIAVMPTIADIEKAAERIRNDLVINRERICSDLVI
jgi:LL-diaminopimelate aminotransferase